jgi:hypothetical protein
MAHPHVSDGDLKAIGATVLNIVAAVQQLGHTSPASTLNYMTWVDALDGEESAASYILRDFIAWTCGRKEMSPGCDDRLKAYVNQSGWAQRSSDSVARELYSQPA